MDAIQNSVSQSDQMQVLKFNRCEPTNYRNKSHGVRVFEVLQSLRKDEVLCDIKLQSDDGIIVYGHKLVLVSTSPYFRTMFTGFDKNNNDLVIIKGLDSTHLHLLVDYLYTGEIIVTEQNVQVLLPAAILLQLDYVKGVCVDYLQRQLNPSNSIGIKLFADHYNCMELVSSSEAYIKKHFLEVVKYDEFLSLSFEEVFKLISCNDLTVPFEEKLFECVINWVKHELGCRHDKLPKLMEHVRLSLVSMEYISEKVVGELLLEDSPKCKDFVIEALHFHLLKIKQLNIPIPQTIRNTPRQPGGLRKDILVLSWSSEIVNSCMNWYEPATNLWQIGPEISKLCLPSVLALIKEHFVIAMNDEYGSVEMLDLSLQSPCWVSKDDMLISQKNCGVGVLDDCLYAVGGYNNTNGSLKSAEVFDVSIQKWRMVSNMSTKRYGLGVAVLNNLLYAVGGHNGLMDLKSVEYYDSSLNKWSPVAEMSVCRSGVSVGVLYGMLYAVGGRNESGHLKSVEVYNPSVGVWTSIADMHLCRSSAGVFVLDGLLYVMGGRYGSTILNSIEVYDPRINTWSMKTLPKSGYQIHGAVVVNRPPFWN